jgi:outer membrane receptor for ferrienterochelin and colicin
MTKKTVNFLTFGVLLFLLASSAFAQDDSNSNEIDSLYTLSLEELLNIRIITASKTEETVQEAPAVISVITAKEIESYGGSNLVEVLDRATSIYMTGTFVMTNNLIGLRGQTDANWCTKVLILINGRPHRDSFFGGSLINVLNGYPLSAIERLEIIRGPGSVLYGSNAFVGVINIILKRAESNQVTTTMRYGSFNTINSSVSAGIKHKDFVLNSDVSMYSTDGWKFESRDENSIVRSRSKATPVYDSIVRPARSFNMMRKDLGATLNGSYKGFSLTSFFGHSRWSNMPTSARWVLPVNAPPLAKPVEVEGLGSKLFVDLGYTREITENYTTSLNVTWNGTYSGQEVFTSQNRSLASHTNDWLMEWQNNFSVTDKVTGVVGLVANKQTGYAKDYTLNPDATPFAQNQELKNHAGYDVVPAWDETWYTGYAQMSYSPSTWLKLVAGVQANKITDIKWNYSPRFGIIIDRPSGFGAKLLYGDAFRAATPGAEQGIQLRNVIHGNPLMKPELISTYEGQLFMRKKRIEASIGYFHSMQSQLIGRSSSSDPNNIIPNTPQFINVGSLESYGFEAETKFYLTSKLNGQASFSSQQSENNSDQKNYSGTPIYMAKIGLHYETVTGLSVGVFHTYFGKGGNIRATFSSDNAPANFQGTPVNANPPMEAVHYTTVNASLNLQKCLKTDVPNATLFCYAVNLFDQDVYYPETARRNLNTIPGRAGFNIHGGVTLKF